MPYEIVRIAPRVYQVRNKITGRIHAYHTTLAKAKAQVRLLHAIDRVMKKKK